jgi:hypothetical protein
VVWRDPGAGAGRDLAAERAGTLAATFFAGAFLAARGAALRFAVARLAAGRRAGRFFADAFDFRCNFLAGLRLLDLTLFRAVRFGAI